MDSARTAVFQSHDRAGSQFVFERQTPEMRIRRLDAGINSPQARPQDWCRPRTPSQWAEVAVCDWQYIHVVGSDQGNNRIRWRILNYVESNVAEVTLVADAVSSAQRTASIPEEVPCKANSRSKVAPARRPEFVNGIV